MGESAEVQDDDNMDFCKESNGKKAKTPSQLEALKEIYRVNKYPTEEIKLRLAQQLGLTEKQVTNWFSNRRVRDKRAQLKDEECGDARQNVLDGVILRDLGSGFGQDSYGSMKPGNSGPPIDSRDVESRSLHGQDSPSADLTYDLRSCHPGNMGVTDDMSSDSSSALHERCYSQGMDKYDVWSSRFITLHGVGTPASSNSIGDMRINNKPAGYLKVRGEIENATVTAVKRRLGWHYREDGPPLGIEFQPLPPRAFESAGGQSVSESSYGDDHALSRSPNIHQAHHLPILKARGQFYDKKASSKKSYKNALNSCPMDRPDGCNYQPRLHSKQKCIFSGRSDHLAGTSSSLNMQEYLTGDVSVNGVRKNLLLSSKHTAKIMRFDDGFSGMTEPQRYEYESENVGPRVVQSSKKSREKPPGPLVNAEGGGPSKRISKAKHQGGEEASKKHFNPIRARIHSPKEMTALM